MSVLKFSIYINSDKNIYRCKLKQLDSIPGLETDTSSGLNEDAHENMQAVLLGRKVKVKHNNKNLNSGQKGNFVQLQWVWFYTR